MEKLLDKLSLGLVFRQFICGLIFVTSYFYSGHPQLNPLSMYERYKEMIVPLIVTAFIAGSIIYAVHRSITNPLFELARSCLAEKCKDNLCWIFTSKQLIETTVLRWRTDSRIKSPSQNFYDWGDYVQLLYTSGMSVWLGSFAWFLHKSEGLSSTQFNWQIFLLGGFLLLIGQFNDVRKWHYENELYQYKRTRANPSMPDSEDLARLEWDAKKPETTKPSGSI